MKHIAKDQPNPSVLAPPKDEEALHVMPASFNISRLIDDGLIVLHREIKQLLFRSSKTKLEASDARDLRENLKLLFELKDRENKALSGMTDEELKAKAKELLNDSD